MAQVQGQSAILEKAVTSLYTLVAGLAIASGSGVVVGGWEGSCITRLQRENENKWKKKF